MLANSRGRFIFDGPGITVGADPVEQSARGMLQAAARGGATPSQVRDQIRAGLNLSEAETDLLLRRIATDTIRRQPLDFLLRIPTSLVTLYSLDERGIAVLWPPLAAWAALPHLDSLVRVPDLRSGAQQEPRGRTTQSAASRPLRPGSPVVGIAGPLPGLALSTARRRSAAHRALRLLDPGSGNRRRPGRPLPLRCRTTPDGARGGRPLAWPELGCPAPSAANQHQRSSGWSTWLKALGAPRAGGCARRLPALLGPGAFRTFRLQQ